MSTSAASRVAYRFDSMPGLRVVMSGRLPGTQADGDTGHGPNTVAEHIDSNRRAFLVEAGVNIDDLCVPRQSHGTNVEIATSSDRGRGLYPLFDGYPGTDALVTNEPSIALGTIVADCVPIVLYDEDHSAVALIHAGWRGTVGAIVCETMQAMIESFGTQPSGLQALIGPSIGPCCYQVGDEVVDSWLARGLTDGQRAIRTTTAGINFDLWTANALLLADAGVSINRIEQSGICVRCQHDRFFSYRAAKAGDSPSGRNMMVVQLTPRNNTKGAPQQ